MQASTPEAFKLMMKGSQAFTEIEANGMRIDVDYLDRMIKQTGKKIKEMEYNLRKDEVYKTWRKRYGEKSDLASPKQLGQVIYKELGIECKSFTKMGNPRTDAASLDEIDFPFVKKWKNWESLKKLRSTNLIGVRRETVDGFLHPFFNQHTARSQRSSSSEPNFQNQPNRDPKQAKLIRRAFIPREGHVLVEVDYGGMEWRIASCYSRDEKMIEDSDDPHTMWAAKCFSYDGKVPKDIRHIGKNQFVFPQLYGSFYKKCAINLWGAINSFQDREKVEYNLEEKGIYKLGACDYKLSPQPNTFEEHTKNVEDEFWGRYKAHDVWRKKWAEDYQSEGWFKLLTGFVCQGVYSRNQLFNYPIQGPAYHCLLWSLIEIIKEIKKRGMKTKVCGQIHDSIYADVPLSELEDYLVMVKHIMTEKIREIWKWIVIPLDIEAEASEENWYSKKPIKISE